MRVWFENISGVEIPLGREWVVEKYRNCSYQCSKGTPNNGKYVDGDEWLVKKYIRPSEITGKTKVP